MLFISVMFNLKFNRNYSADNVENVFLITQVSNVFCKVSIGKMFVYKRCFSYRNV